MNTELAYYLEEVIDEIDAALFCGDVFTDEKNREELRRYMARWERRLKEFDQEEK